jgi:hypothetical protein
MAIRGVAVSEVAAVRETSVVVVKSRASAKCEDCIVSSASYSFGCRCGRCRFLDSTKIGPKFLSPEEVSVCAQAQQQSP